MTAARLDALRAALDGPIAVEHAGARREHGGRKAAVLLALSEQPDGLHLVLVEKDGRLRSHAGQLALPGGAIEAADASPTDAALREASEEVGIEPDEIEVLGVLPPAHVRASGFDVTVVIGRWRTPRPLRPVDVGEIAAVHDVAVDRLLDPANRLTWQIGGGSYTGPGFVIDDLFVWGFTAYLLDGVFELAGWTASWDQTRIADVPDRFFRDRSR